MSGPALFGTDLFGEPVKPKARGPLAERFIVPPFTILDARQGDWQNRKRAWISMGLRSEVGRAEGLTFNGAAKWQQENGSPGRTSISLGEKDTSIFDPVLCECLVRWFSNEGDVVVDPFAGGSVRGIVTTSLGRRYWGCDLRSEQIEANERQADEIIDGIGGDDDATPIERRGNYWLKRDDLFAFAGVRGGKVRSCRDIVDRNASGIVTAGSRSSPQVEIVSSIAKHYGLPCRVHVPTGDDTAETLAAAQNGAEVVRHRPGYNSVIVARAREDAEERGWQEVPFGMQCKDAVETNAAQIFHAQLHSSIKRIVVPVGSGMTLAGIVTGIKRRGLGLKVLGVTVGADPIERLDRWAPFWRDFATLVPAGVDYHHRVDAEIDGLNLDPIYEAKCVKFLEPNDLLWVVGVRESSRRDARRPVWVCGDSMDRLDDAPPADLILSCPPYGDLEVYSDDPRDLSNLEWHTFKAAYGRIVLRSVKTLKPNRFAAFVVGDFRDPKGLYRDFVSSTIEAFRNAGASLYNEGILVQAVGSGSMRATRQFGSGRKLCKMHQNVLVFCKGDWREASRRLPRFTSDDDAGDSESSDE